MFHFVFEVVFILLSLLAVYAFIKMADVLDNIDDKVSKALGAPNEFERIFKKKENTQND